MNLYAYRCCTADYFLLPSVIATEIYNNKFNIIIINSHIIISSRRGLHLGIMHSHHHPKKYFILTLPLTYQIMKLSITLEILRCRNRS